MGICSSSESTSVATSKLILQDGRLQEFSYPIRVSEILQKNPNCFICNADDMDLNDVLLAVNEEEKLQVGELYFALPLSWLNNPLSVEEMGSLAVKASLALKMDGKGRVFGGKLCGCGTKKVDPVIFTSKRIIVESNCMVSIGRDDDGGGCRGAFVVKRRSGGGDRKGRNFYTKLGVILEE